MTTTAGSKERIPTGGAHLLERPQQVVDLTREIYTGMPIWQHHQKPFLFDNHRREDCPELFGTAPFLARNMVLSEHTGTHTDAIYEYDPDGPSLDESPLSYYYGPACCIDVSATRYPDHFTPEVLEAADREAGSLIREGDIVLLHTGHGARTYPGQEYLTGYAGLDRAGAEWLADRGVVNIAVDAVSIDHADDGELIGHVVCRERQIVNTESLCNLDQLIGKRFTYYGLPLNLREGTGSPIRAIAVLDA
jgi:kynurenine formamidase